MVSLDSEGFNLSLDQGIGWVGWSQGLSLPEGFEFSELSMLSISKDGRTVYAGIPSLGLVMRSL